MRNDVAVDTFSARARPAAGVRVRHLPAWLLLAGLVSVSFAVRLAAALAHATPRYFPDEYIYASLARSLSEGRLSVRGTPAGFPALLEPILAAPFWLLGDVELAYRLTQGLHVLAVSLTAIPVYLIARRLDLAHWQRHACAGLALVLPAFVYSAYVTADAIALPLAVGAVAAGMAALDRPTRRAQLAFVGLAGLAGFARIQYIVLPVAFLVAALVLARARPGAVVRRYALTLALFSLPLVAAVGAGPGRVLGYYESVLDLELDVGSLVHWAITDSMLLAYAVGWVLVPAAVVGLVTAIARPTSRAERGFAALTAALFVLLLLEAALYASNGSPRFQERYLIALAPFVPLLFCLGLRRLQGRAVATSIWLIAAGMLVLAVRVPLSGYTVNEAKQDSPLLQGIHRLEEIAGYGGGSLLVAAIAGASMLLAALTAFRPRVGGPLSLAVCAATLAATAVGGVSYDIDRSRLAQATFLGADPRWVDRAALGDSAVLLTPGSVRAAVSEQLFWNHSLTTLLRLPGADDVDVYGSTSVIVAADGRLVARGRAVRRPLLVQEHAAHLDLDGASLVRRNAGAALWRPAGTPRVRLLFEGRYLDGWLRAPSRLTIWPYPNAHRTRLVRFTLSLPAGVPDTAVVLSAPGLEKTVTLRAGEPKPLTLTVPGGSPWTLVLRPRRRYLVPGGRVVLAQSTVPELAELAAKKS